MPRNDVEGSQAWTLLKSVPFLSPPAVWLLSLSAGPDSRACGRSPRGPQGRAFGWREHGPWAADRSAWRGPGLVKETSGWPGVQRTSLRSQGPWPLFCALLFFKHCRPEVCCFPSSLVILAPGSVQPNPLRGQWVFQIVSSSSASVPGSGTFLLIRTASC